MLFSGLSRGSLPLESYHLLGRSERVHNNSINWPAIGKDLMAGQAEPAFSFLRY